MTELRIADRPAQMVAATGPGSACAFISTPRNPFLRVQANPFVRFFLGEVLLGFLAIVAAALTLIPMLFRVAPSTNSWLETGQWVIVAFFAAEYGLGLICASSRAAFMRSSWRLIDAATIILPMATFVPGVAAWLRSTPVLRLLRLARVLTLGVRASGVIVREDKSAAAAQKAAPVQIRRLGQKNQIVVKHIIIVGSSSISDRRFSR